MSSSVLAKEIAEEVAVMSRRSFYRGRTVKFKEDIAALIDQKLSGVRKVEFACAEMYDLCDWGMMEPGTQEKYTDIIIESLIDCQPAYDAMMADIDKLMDLDPAADSENGQLLKRLAALIEKYEDAYVKIDNVPETKE